MKLWDGRLEDALDPLAARLNDSLPFDRRLAREDVQGSLAWTQALARAGVLTHPEAERLAEGLKQIAGEFTSGGFEFRGSDEDIHTAVERRLTELTGPVAGKLHTGRSRNDQVATDLRLWMMAALRGVSGEVAQLERALLGRAAQDRGIILPGYTHLRPAQPILLAHWWLAHLWAFERDRTRLGTLAHNTSVMPLGSGALAGTTVGVDRWELARELGFETPSSNSLDAVSDRDFVAEFLFVATLIGVHLSRLAEALILYSTAEFAFLAISDRYATGSSMMPQKKNPDLLELIRAKSAVLLGKLAGWLATVRTLPSAYDKDLQQDKPAVFEATDDLILMLPVMTGVLRSLTINPGRMREAIPPEAMATDLADYLVARGVPFREARELVAQAVSVAEKLGCRLDRLPLEQWQTINPTFDKDLFGVFDVEASIARRTVWGGTALDAVQEQMELAERALEENEG